MLDLMETIDVGQASVADPNRALKRLRLEVMLSSERGSQPAIVENLRAAGAGVAGAIGLQLRQPVMLEFINGRSIAASVVSRAPGQTAVEFVLPLHRHDPLLRLAGHWN